MQIQEIEINPPFIKLDQFLKFAGVCTGGQAKNIIFDGLVKVNGEVCLMRGKKLFGEEIIEIEIENMQSEAFRCILKE